MGETMFAYGLLIYFLIGWGVYNEDKTSPIPEACRGRHPFLRLFFFWPCLLGKAIMSAYIYHTSYKYSFIQASPEHYLYQIKNLLDNIDRRIYNMEEMAHNEQRDNAV